MTNYTLLTHIESLGGVLRRSDVLASLSDGRRSGVNLSTGEIYPLGAVAVADSRGLPAGLPAGDEDSPQDSPQRVAVDVALSLSHISPQVLQTVNFERLPQVEYYDGGSLFKVFRGGPTQEQKGGGKRSAVTSFSADSRRRLMQEIAKIKVTELPHFVTLTYPAEFPTARQSKKHLDTFAKRFRRRFPSGSFIWKLEPQERGAPHFHLLVWGVSLAELRIFVPEAWYDIAGGGDYKHYIWHIGMAGNGNTHCVQAVRSFKGVWAYASKYLGKTFDVAGWEGQFPGRFWGIVNRAAVPWAEKKHRIVSRADACTAMRYGRRFMKAKKARSVNRSMTLYCSASHWARSLNLLC
jgi:hypothetical protein